MAEPTVADAVTPVTLDAQSVVKEELPASPVKDDGANRERSSLFDRLGSEHNARLISVYIDITLRAVMAFLFYFLTCCWLAAVFCLLVVQQTCATKHLSDTVLVTLLTTTTINVLGLVTAVAVYLFPRNVRSKVAEVTDPDQPAT